MFSMCSELTPRAHIPDTRIPQLMQPCPKKLVSECCMSPKILTKNGWVGQKFPLDMTWECMISFFGTPFRPMIQNHVTVLAPTIFNFFVNIWTSPPIAKMMVVLEGTAPSVSWPLLFAEKFKAEKQFWILWCYQVSWTRVVPPSF